MRKLEEILTPTYTLSRGEWLVKPPGTRDNSHLTIQSIGSIDIISLVNSIIMCGVVKFTSTSSLSTEHASRLAEFRPTNNQHHPLHFT